MKALWKSAMKYESAMEKRYEIWKRYENAQVPRNYSWCQFFPLNQWNFAYWKIIMRYAYYLEKIPSSDDFANILELLYTL